jgi:hypothetical protein
MVRPTTPQSRGAFCGPEIVPRFEATAERKSQGARPFSPSGLTCDMRVELGGCTVKDVKFSP